MQKSILIVSLIVSLFVVMNPVFAGRYYIPEIGRWATPDPNAQNYPNLSPYCYAANNPLKFTDPDGKDIVLVHNPVVYLPGTDLAGHNALLIGNENDGWQLYSKNGEQYVLFGADKNNVGVKFNSLSDFASSEKGQDYKVGVQFITDTKTDEKAKQIGSEIIKKEYGISNGANCADFCGDVAKGVGVDINKPKKEISKEISIKIGNKVIKKTITVFNYTDPTQQLNQAKAEEGVIIIDFDKIRKEQE